VLVVVLEVVVGVVAINPMLLEVAELVAGLAVREDQPLDFIFL
jgi:hypothetical protein